MSAETIGYSDPETLPHLTDEALHAEMRREFAVLFDGRESVPYDQMIAFLVLDQGIEEQVSTVLVMLVEEGFLLCLENGCYALPPEAPAGEPEPIIEELVVVEVPAEPELVAEEAPAPEKKTAKKAAKAAVKAAAPKPVVERAPKPEKPRKIAPEQPKQEDAAESEVVSAEVELPESADKPFSPRARMYARDIVHRLSWAVARDEGVSVAAVVEHVSDGQVTPKQITRIIERLCYRGLIVYDESAKRLRLSPDFPRKAEDRDRAVVVIISGLGQVFDPVIR